MNGEVPGWYDQAACKGKPTEWWFSPNPAEYRIAKQICDTCPVISECDQHATANHEHGIWGGRARKLGSDPDAQYVLRKCRVCATPFLADRRRGRMTTVCGDACLRERIRATKRATSMRRSKRPGLFFARGHGKISRYQKGCRCKACARVAREQRARQRSSAA